MVDFLSTNKRFAICRLSGDRIRVIDRETGEKAYYHFTVERHLQAGHDNPDMQTVAYYWFAARLSNHGQTMMQKMKSLFV